MTDQYEIKTTGEAAPAGKYFCDKCGTGYEQENDGQPLPDCPKEGIWTVWNPEQMTVRNY